MVVDDSPKMESAVDYSDIKELAEEEEEEQNKVKSAMGSMVPPSSGKQVDDTVLPFELYTAIIKSYLFLIIPMWHVTCCFM